MRQDAKGLLRRPRGGVPLNGRVSPPQPHSSGELLLTDQPATKEIRLNYYWYAAIAMVV